MAGEKVVISGGSGLIGRRLTDMLTAEGYRVVWLSRDPGTRAEVNVFEWSVRKQYIDPLALKGATAVIHLAGAGIADWFWTEERKALIIKSRTEGTKLLARAISDMADPPRVFIGASAVGFYGDRGEEILTEESDPGVDAFLPVSVLEIEHTINEHIPRGVRTVIPRFGIVMSTQGGALQRTLLPLRLGIATYFGNGRQFVPWVHIDDICHFLMEAIRNEKMSGTYNVTAPDPVTSYALAGALRKYWSAFSLRLPAPAFLLRSLLGEMSHTVLDSTRAVPARLLEMGFRFRFHELGAALAELKRTRK